MVLNNKIRDIIFTQQKNNYYTNDLKSISKPLDELIGINNMCSKNMEIILNKTIKLKKRGSKKKEMTVDKLDSKETSNDIDENILDYRSDEDLETSVGDMEIVEPENEIISRDISSNELDYDDYDEDDEDNEEQEKQEKQEIIEQSDKDEKTISMKLSDNTGNSKDDSKDVSKDVSKDDSINIDGGNNMDNLLFLSLNEIHKKGGSKPNLTQNFNNESVGGGINTNTKTIKLTEHYNFF